MTSLRFSGFRGIGLWAQEGGNSGPDLILTGWDELISFDAGAGAGLFSRQQYGSQDFGGPAQLVATIGMRFSPFTHSYADFHLLHFSDAGLYGSDSLGVDMFIFEVGYKF
jgi:hypothetical protein